MDLDIRFLQGLDERDIGAGGDERFLAQRFPVGQEVRNWSLSDSAFLITRETPLAWSPDDGAPMIRSPAASFAPVTILSGGAMMPVTQPDRDGALRTGGSALTRYRRAGDSPAGRAIPHISQA